MALILHERLKDQLKKDLKYFLLTFFSAYSLLCHAQVFTEGEVQSLVKQGAHHIYNSDLDSANYYAKQVENIIPDHPVVPLMRGMAILWANIPTISVELFAEIESKLDSAINQAKKADPQLEDPEMIFFAMAAHGLLAEYYADQDYMMNAVGQANKAYGMLREGFDLVDTHPEFLIATGLYNYFIEKYPEKHPIYKPFLWFFRSGDAEKGISQLEYAAENAILTDVEAHVYLSYIYLRYEYKPKQAQEHLALLCKKYPENFYAKAKYLESLANPHDFKEVPLQMIYELIRHPSPYYKLAGFTFLGYYEEAIITNQKKAKFAYSEGLRYGEKIPSHGEFFKSFSNLGLGRIMVKENNTVEAKKFLDLALDYAETEQVISEAKKLLADLE